MAIVTTGLGPNSLQIDYDAGENMTGIIDTIESFITTHGWETFDPNAGVDARGYKARNYDNPAGDVDSWKYVVLDWGNNVLKTVLYEKWDNINHVGTNKADRSNQDAYGQPINTSSGGTLFVFSHYRWLVFLAYVGGVYGDSSGNSFTGVFEVERANATDTWDAPDPLAPVIWGPGYYLGVGDGSETKYFAWTRTKTGKTGGDAINNTILACLGCKLGRYMNDALRTTPTGVNPWTGKNWVFNLVAGHGYPSYAIPVEFRGRIFGLKLVQRGLGANMDTAVIEVDANYFWVEGGTATEHFILTSPKLNFVIPK